MEDVCPTDPRRKYDYLQALKSGGLAVKAAMLTYRHGNNIGNTNCIWKVPEQDPDSFSQSQQTIEIVKKQIPVSHKNNATITDAEIWKSCSKQSQLFCVASTGT